MNKSIYTFRCNVTGESSNVLVCDVCAEQMPDVNGADVTAVAADNDCDCEFCDR